MTDVLFYHLQHQPVEAVLPGLLLRSLERGWRVAVEAGDEQRMAALDDHLWTFSDDSFLPHGSAREPDIAGQPVALLCDGGNPNNATVRFLVYGARAPDDISGWLRIVLMFDGGDEVALAAAREDWRKMKAAGADATYWQQNDVGKWEKKA